MSIIKTYCIKTSRDCNNCTKRNTMLGRLLSKTAWKGRGATAVARPQVFGNRACIATIATSTDIFRSPSSSIHRQSALKGTFPAARLLSTKSETKEFQAETRKLLDIVTNSIYTDKEVFIRELISNASDALEKYRYKQVTGEAVAGSGEQHPLEINIITDTTANTLTLVDNGIGMSREDLVSNLGTIARSGSKQFVDQMKTSTSPTGGDTTGIIGQFGVGFYSSFMVAESVSVESVPAIMTTSGDATITPGPHKWSSDGSGTFTIEDAPDSEVVQVGRGTRIVMKLKDTCKEFAEEGKIKGIIKRYSNFVAFPIKLNGQPINTVSAIWMQDKSTLTEAQYDEFYKYVAGSYDKPKFTLHFRADAPIDLKCLLYIPSFHTEKFGMGRMEPGVNLYSRKILIENKPKDLLPEWLRFIKGVVDSEDLPLSISREKSQDSTLLRRIRDVLTRKIIRFLSDEAKNRPAAYREFYAEFSYFIKEGVCHDYQFMDQLSKLLLFETSSKPDGELISLDDYISRCTPEQKQIYYLVAPNRDAALNSPYYETFSRNGQEVLLLYNTIDDFVMSNIKTFAGRELVSAESSNVNLDAAPAADDKGDASKKDKTDIPKLSEAEAAVLCEWLKNSLGSHRVRDVKTTSRLSDSPAIITDHESGALRRMMKMLVSECVES